MSSVPDPKPETPWNEAKVYGETACPPGRYRVILSTSPRFGKNAFYQSICADENGVARAPELLGVPGFGGIRIHVGNYAKDTEGCILVGKGSLPTLEMITQSRLAYREVMALLLDCEKRQEPAWLTIVNPPQPSAR
jgi:hypothetical protein